jgi:manganese-dependent inorganic pyrophosphatase
MPALTYVIGHKNSDLDSVCSAIAYAHLCAAQGDTNVIPARHGALKPEIRFVLDRFHVPVPLALNDVFLRVRDVMRRDFFTARTGEILLEVGRRLQDYNIRSMPVVDEHGAVHGMISVESFAQLFFQDIDPDSINRITLDLENIVHALHGSLLIPAGRPLGNRVLVGAMRAETMATYIEPGCLVVLGDHEHAQQTAIRVGAGALVITGGLPVSAATLQLAREQGAAIISTKHHTFAAVRLINLSMPVESIMSTNFAPCQISDLVAEVRPRLRQYRSLPVLDDDNRLVGLVTRSSALAPERTRLVLVDHNERSQAIDGLEEAELLAVYDHHRVSDVHTDRPIIFRVEPVGSTGTIMATLYEEAGVPIPPAIAGLLLAGLLYDTLILRSPTCTPRDKRIAEHLAGLAEVDIDTYGQEIFNAAADYDRKSPEELLTGDFKEFVIGTAKFGVGTVETASPAPILARKAELLKAMERLAQERDYLSFLFMIVDIIHLRCHLLVCGQERVVAEAFERDLGDDRHTVVIPDLVSRKKQVVPVLPRIAELAGAPA